MRGNKGAIAIVIVLTASSCAEKISVESTSLPPSEGPKTVELCSRMGVGGVDGYFLPHASDIRRLEDKLPGMFRWSSSARPPKGLSDYGRQYIGYVREGRKVIYVQFLPIGVLKEPEFSEWRNRFIDVCDGGANFWSAHFDLESEVFFGIGSNAGRDFWNPTSD